MNFNIFAILKAQKGRESRLISCFLDKDITNAKIYFQGYIFGEKDTIDYTLYQVGTINKWLQIEPKKIYICNGFQAEQKTEMEHKISKIEQCKIDWDKYTDKKPLNTKEAIEILFDGSKINEKKAEINILDKQMAGH